MPEWPPKDRSPGLRRPSPLRRSDVARLHDAHGAGLYRYAVMLLADTTLAQDAVQQVFAGLLRQRGPIQDEAHYLRRATRNACYSLLRGRQRTEQHSTDRALLELLPGVDVAPERRLAVEQALLTLVPEQREVVHLHVYEGWTFQQIADALEESINTVAGRYRYALANLRKVLQAAP